MNPWRLLIQPRGIQGQGLFGGRHADWYNNTAWQVSLTELHEFIIVLHVQNLPLCPTWTPAQLELDFDLAQCTTILNTEHVTAEIQGMSCSIDTLCPNRRLERMANAVNATVP